MRHPPYRPATLGYGVRGVDMAKTACVIDRGEFRTNAKPVVASVGGTAVVACVKEFSTRSLGWYATGKVLVDMGGKQVMCQVGLTVTVIGSKELPA